HTDFSAKASRMSGKIFCILFVDDEPWLSAPLRLSLEARGFKCLSTSNMSQGWAALQDNEIDVLVTDIMMPGGDGFPGIDSYSAGFVFVKKVRQQFPKMAIICLSVI